MRLAKQYKLTDIKEYEIENNVNIIKFFDECWNDINLIELIKIGNKNCSDEQASVILDMYLKEGNTVIDAYMEIKNCLLGDKKDDESVEYLDVTKYSSITDLYNEMCMQIMALGVGYSEFWGMNTKDIYRVFDSIVIKINADTNRKLQIAHMQAAMIGAAAWGQLSKEPPHVELGYAKEKERDTVFIEGMGEVDRRTAKNIMYMKSLTYNGD